MRVAFISSVVLAGLISGTLLFFSWVCRRNFRRLLFGIACLVTLLALAYAEENWRGRYAWQKHRREWEAKGEKFMIAELAPPPVPDEKNFALAPLLKPALDYTQEPTGVVWHDTNGAARLDKIDVELSPHRDTNNRLVLGSLEEGKFADLAACREFYRGNTNYPQPTTSGTAAEDILVALGKFAPELQELSKDAATRPYARFPIQYDYQPSWAILLPHLSRVKALARLVNMRATAELEAGRSGEAFEDLKLGLRLSESIHDEPILIDHLVRLAALSIDLQTVREGLVRHAWTEAQLAELESSLTSLDLLAEYKLAMRGERALSTAGLDYVRRQDFRGNPMYYMGEEGNARSAQVFNLMPSGWLFQNMLTISRMNQDFILPAADERAHRVFPGVSASGSHALQNLRAGPYTIFAMMLLPALEKVVAKSARMQTYADAARVACALERYRLANGQLPGTLEPLIPRFVDVIPNDVIDGKPLRYRRNSDGGYVLYSVGWNQTDDGGQAGWTSENKQETSGIDITKGDWVWLMPAR
jgi:hypothetical protein